MLEKLFNHYHSNLNQANSRVHSEKRMALNWIPNRGAKPISQCMIPSLLTSTHLLLLTPSYRIQVPATPPKEQQLYSSQSSNIPLSSRTSITQMKSHRLTSNNNSMLHLVKVEVRTITIMLVSTIDSSSKERSTSLLCTIIKTLTNLILNSFKKVMKMSTRIIIKSSL